MAPPSYARATASSILKASPSSPSRPKDPETPKSTPKKKLKRPSTLTPQHRLSITYKADLYPITPLNPTKPCPLANLPSEIRTSIYHYALESHLALLQPRFIIKPRTGSVHYIWPKILHISRAIRIEAAYVYYTSTPFTFTVRNLDFSKIVLWLEHLPPRHRALLTRNRHLTIKIIPGLRQGFSYPPPGWLLDAWMSQHWKDCSAFGNVYTISSNAHRIHFILFCRLQGWFRLHDMLPYRDVRWEYLFDSSFPKSIWEQCSSAETLVEVLRDQVGVLGTGCVAKVWVRGNVAGRGREEARAFLGALDEVFERTDSTDGVAEDWAEEMSRLKRSVESW
jgi:hypothetical protein